MRFEPGSLGGAVYSASTSVSRTSASATTMLAMSADRRSLSPNRISLDARESFSLMLGTAPKSSRRSSVRRTLRYCCGAMVSEAVMRICPTRSPYRAKAASYWAISRPWPTAAHACWSATSVGRLSKPSVPKPAAIAPEETSTTRPPINRTRAMAATSAFNRCGSKWPLGSVSELEPTFTTMVCASAMALRTCACDGVFIVPPGTVTGY